MKIDLKPIGKWVVLEAFKPDAGPIALAGIVQPEAVRANQRPPSIYRVVAVGEGRMTSDGKMIAFPFTVGDEVTPGPDCMIAELDPMIYGKGKLLVDGTGLIAVVNGREGDKIAEQPMPQILTPGKKLVVQ